MEEPTQPSIVIKPSSLPPAAKTFGVIGSKIVDIAAIGAVTFLAYNKILTGTESGILIALFAGAHLGQILSGDKATQNSGIIIGLVKLFALGKIQ